MTSTSSQSDFICWITHLVGGPKAYNHAAVAVGSRIYSFGGFCAERRKAFTEYETSMQVYVLNTSTFRWKKHAISDLSYWENHGFVPYERYGHTAVVYENKVYVWGGRNHRSCDDVLFCFDPVCHCWTAPATTGTIPVARNGHTACLWNKYMIIFGGYEAKTESMAELVYALDLQKMKWKQLKTSKGPPSPRDFHTAVCLNNRMYVFGGDGGHYVYCNVLWYLDLKNKIWVAPTVTGNIPIGRENHSAFLYNNKMYIFGGYNSLGETHFNDMYQFDPATNHWTAIHSGGVKPCERLGQACVVVGDQTFLFGGTSPPIPRVYERREDKMIVHNDLCVLDFKTTLKKLCLMSGRKHKLDGGVLPLNLRVDLRNISTPNKISRPNN